MPLPREQSYTYEDLLNWPEDERIELIYGEPHMQAAPSRRHQRAVSSFNAQLYNYLQGKRCQVYPAPFDVRLFEEKSDVPYNVDTVVEPDITVVCDPGKLDDAGCVGAPDLIIEVLSPASVRHDRVTKFNLYQAAGVKEYWIADPDAKTVQVFTLSNGAYQAKELYGAGDEAEAGVLEDCKIDLSQVFDE